MWTGAISNKLTDWGIQQQWNTELFPTSSSLHINLSNIEKMMGNLETKFSRSCVYFLLYVQTDISKTNLVATGSGLVLSTEILYNRYQRYNPIWKLRFCGLVASNPNIRQITCRMWASKIVFERHRVQVFKGFTRFGFQKNGHLNAFSSLCGSGWILINSLTGAASLDKRARGGT